MDVNFRQDLGVTEYFLNKPLKKYSSFLYGTVPLRPLHLGFDPALNLINYLTKKKKLNPKIILGDTFAFLDKNVSIFSEEYGNILNYYKFFFSTVGLNKSDFILHSDTFKKIKYWKLVASGSMFFGEREMIKSSLIKRSNYKEVPLVTYMHPLLQSIDICFHKPSLVMGYSSQRRIYIMSKLILKKLNFKSDLGYIFLREYKDIEGNLLKDSTSETRISYHESETSLDRKISKISYNNKEIIKDIYLQSIYPFLLKEIQNVTSMSKKEFISFFEKITNKEFKKIKRLSVQLLNSRFNRYRKVFRENPAWIDWINSDKIQIPK